MAGAGGISVATLRRGRRQAQGRSFSLGLRRVFGGLRPQTAVKGTSIWVIYTVLVLVIMVAIGVGSMKEFGLS